jgi:MtrB/PioB family decaheme-associated outer membrane protein
MRTRLVIIAAALLASASWAHAQASGDQTQPPPLTQAPAPSQETIPALGSIDFGFRGSPDLNGDNARYERYRDLRDGAFSQIVLEKATPTTMFDAKAFNIGYHDQQYLLNYSGGPGRVTFNWTSTPLNYGYNTATPWTQTAAGVLGLSAAARQQVQNKAAGVVGVPSTASQLLTSSIYRGLAQPYDLTSRRDAANIAVAYDATKDVGFTATFTTTKRSGYQPWGASFAFNNANEVPLPLDNRTNDFSTGLEYSNAKGMLRVAWDASWFSNNLHELVWDNPIRLTDTTPYDPSGYSNGNGPAQGRMSLAPSNNMNAFSGTALYKLPAHSTLNGTLSYTLMNQNDALIPWTINPAIANPSVYASFPGLATLPRNTAEAEVHGVNGLVNFVTRPSRYFGLTARYRFNDHRNLTPMFDAREYVRFDAVPEETGGETEQFDIRQNTFDLNATFSPFTYTSFRIGYGYDTFNRTGRAFSDMTDNTVRASVDTVGNRYVTVHGIYEFTVRKGSGFSEASIEDGGSQPGLRFYDEADRDRNKATVVFVLNPVDVIDVTFSAALGKDAYKGPGHEFGLLDNTNHSYNVGLNVNPAERVGFGANYGRDHFDSNQLSRNANPPPDLQFNDPTRNWSLANAENVNNFDLYLDLPKIIRKTNVKVAYDYSDSDNGFTFGGPRIASLTAAGQFIPLPNVTNTWHRATADVSYFFHKQVGVAFGYWYEKFDVSDFATVNLPDGTPRIDYLGEISTGYGNRPYKGGTAFVRLLALF